MIMSTDKKCAVAAITSLPNGGKTSTLMTILKRQLYDGKKILFISDTHVNLENFVKNNNKFFDPNMINSNMGYVKELIANNNSDLMKILNYDGLIGLYDVLIIDNIDRIIFEDELFHYGYKYNAMVYNKLNEKIKGFSLDWFVYTYNLEKSKNNNTEEIFGNMNNMNSVIKANNLIYTTCDNTGTLHTVDFKTVDSREIKCKNLYN